MHTMTLISRFYPFLFK